MYSSLAKMRRWWWKWRSGEAGLVAESVATGVHKCDMYIYGDVQDGMHMSHKVNTSFSVAFLVRCLSGWPEV